MTNLTERPLPTQEDSSLPVPTPDEVAQRFQYYLAQLDLLTQSINDTTTHLNQLLADF